ncbi:MAG: DUF1318 domain-containing protein [Thermodesulfovibrionales bacterium]
MKKKVYLAALLAFFFAACAVITVNIYFPEKDVKEAYKSLEKELMTPGAPGKGGPEEQQSNSPGNQSGAPGSKSGSKEESSLRFGLTSLAYAQEPGLADKIAEAVKRMPDVVAAYREMGARLPDIDRLRNSGAVGEGNNGMLAVREGALNPADKTLMERENENRKAVIRGMAKAIVRLNRLPENQENLNQVTPQAVEQFASIRRDEAKKGWWVQEPGGNWIRK